MKKNDLKALLKPIIKEALKEMLFEEEGVLAHVIGETLKASGMQHAAQINESRTERPTPRTSSDPIRRFIEQSRQASATKPKEDVSAAKQRLIEGAKKSGFGKLSEGILATAFEGTTPLETGGEEMMMSSPAGAVAGGVGDPLAGLAPEDPGVDISQLFGKR